ncbi:MAG: ABC transporter permease [Acidobacteriaceae bacterium]|nr:ABC transporter permease [Acidobacteriaceae bacterium]
MFSSLKLAIRSLGHSPGFTALAIGILTLGIGATTAMFSITRTVLLKPLGYRDPAQLVTVLFRVPSFSKQITTVPVNAQHYRLWRDHARSFQEIAVLGPTSHILSGVGEPESVAGVRVSANFFHLVGVQPAIGRSFAAGEDEAGRDHVAIVSDHFWRHKLGGRSDELGRKIRFDGVPYQIIGVMPPMFPFPCGGQLSDVVALAERTDYWLPLVFGESDLSSPIMNLDYLAIARLRPGITVRQAVTELDALEKGIQKQFPEKVEFDIVVHPLQQLMSREVRLPLLILMGAVGAVLLIVCINMMNLMMVRAISQRRDWAIRLAMGAGARDLIRGALSESLLLSLAGAGAGSLLAGWLLELVRLRAPVDLPRIEELALDPPALLFALGASVASAVLFGIWPAWRSAQADPQEALQSSGRGATEGRSGRRAGTLLVAAEVALSTVLLLSAGLLLRSFVAILDVSPGVRVEHLLTAGIKLPPDKYNKVADIHSFYRSLVEKVSSLPGVTAAGTVSTLPVRPEDNNNPITAGDRAVPPVTQWAMSHIHSASGGYFRAAGIPVKAGRAFEERDGKALEAVISENLAARLWPGESAIGRPLKLYAARSQAKVVGVVGAVRAGSLTEQPGMSVYFPDWEEADGDMSLVVRTAGEPENVRSAVRSVIRALEPQAAIPDMQTMKQVVTGSLSTRRFQLILLVSFAAAALLLASLGIYGVLAFATTRRTSEIGLRMALGAEPKQIFAAILRHGIAPVLIGMTVGLCASAALSHVLQSVLFEVKALDPLIYATAPALLLLVAALACFLPARRAAKLNPVEALRHQ